MGQSVSFLDATHTPTGDKQKDEWEKKYRWEEPHSWDYPMLPTKMTEASCAKCHERMDPFGFALERFDAVGRRSGR